MTWNVAQIAGRFSIPGFTSFEREEPWLHRIVPDVVPAIDKIQAIAPPARKATAHEEVASGLKIHCDKQLGVLEIVDPRMFRPGKEKFCRELSASAISISGAVGIALDLSTHLCRFHFEPDRFDEAELARRVALSIQAATMAVQLDGSGCNDDQISNNSPEAATSSEPEEELPGTTDSERWLCTALGSGSLLVGVAGFILPGIPSVPFLLFSAHYFLRSSTTFKRWLNGLPRLSEIVRKLEASGQMVLDRSTLLKTLGIGILLGLVFLVIHPPLPLVVAIELGLTLFLGLREIGDLECLTDEISTLFS